MFLGRKKTGRSIGVHIEQEPKTYLLKCPGLTTRNTVPAFWLTPRTKEIRINIIKQIQ